MYKLAQLKEAEVRGVVAALIDNGVLAIDSAEQFEKTASDASALLEGYDYDINDVANAAAYSLQKQAEEAEGNALNDQVTAALGELTLSKMAGEIDEDTFNYYADAIVKQAAEDDKGKSQGIPNSVSNVASLAGVGAAYGAGIKNQLKKIKNSPAAQSAKTLIGKRPVYTKAIMDGITDSVAGKHGFAKMVGRAGAAQAGVIGAYLGGKKALQAYKNRKNKQD